MVLDTLDIEKNDLLYDIKNQTVFDGFPLYNTEERKKEYNYSKKTSETFQHSKMT